MCVSVCVHVCVCVCVCVLCVCACVHLHVCVFGGIRFDGWGWTRYDSGFIPSGLVQVPFHQV